MVNFIIVLSPAAIWASYRLIRYCISVYRELTIINKLNDAGVEHAMVTKDQIYFDR